MDIGRLILFPVIATQGLWVAWRTQQLPEPHGARRGTIGHGPVLRVLIVGDSSAAGVGVGHQNEALSGQTMRRLAQNFTVHWRVIAKSGATAGDTVTLLEDADAEAFDVAITALGVNDTKNGVSAAAWQRNYAQVLALLKSRFDVQRITVSGLPPIQDFPRLPQPLKYVLSRRARYFDQLLQQVASRTAQTSFLPMPLSLDPQHMAKDGFHAGPRIYAQWGDHTAAAISAQIAH